MRGLEKTVKNTDQRILAEIGFCYLQSYAVAGMSEPWSTKMGPTLRLLKEEGVGAILTLTEDNLYGGEYVGAGFLNHHEPVEDCEPPSRRGMDRALAFIDRCLHEGRGVAVHCLEGRGRTGTVLAAWLGRREQLDAGEAIRRVRADRALTVITPTQRSFLDTYLNGGKAGENNIK